MGLSDELARPLPTIPHPRLPKHPGVLEREANRLAALFDGVPKTLQPAEDRIARVEQALGADGAGLEALGRKDLKVVPYVIWGVDPRWRLNPGFVRRFLQLVAALWPRAVKRLWRHYTVNFDRECPATLELADWLMQRRDHLSDQLRAFSDEFAILIPARAPTMLTEAALDGDRLITACEAIGLSLATLRSSGLFASVLEATGIALSNGHGATRVPARLTALLAERADNAIAGMKCGAELRARALRALVDGLVVWQERQRDDSDLDRTIDFLLSLNGDPRFVSGRWRGHVADRSITNLEGWLSRQTIEAFFRVINRLKTERPDMWEQRHYFWRQYLPHVGKAWLVVGGAAVELAIQEGVKRFGRFIAGARKDHCGLMIQIRDLCILEMNIVGTAMFWKADSPELPGLYSDRYDRNDYIKGRYLPNVVAITHHGNWQQKFADEIFKKTGIDKRWPQYG